MPDERGTRGTAIDVAVLADRVPTRGLRLGDRRTVDLLTELTAVLPDASVSLVSTDWCDRPSEPDCPAGTDLIAQQENWPAWAAGRVPDLVAVTGPVAAGRFAALLSSVWSEVPVVADTAALVSPERAGLDSSRDPDGAARAVDAWRDADLRLLRRATLVLCASRADDEVVRTLHPAATRVLLPGRFRVAADAAGFQGLSHLGFIGSFVEGLDAPDEDAALFLAQDVLPHVRARVPDAVLHLVGEDIPPIVRALDGDAIEVRWLEGTARDALASVDVVIAARRFGRCSALPVAAALEADVAILGVGESCPHEVPRRLPADPELVADGVASLLTDSKAWVSARESLRSRTRDWLEPSSYRATLVAALQARGLLQGSVDPFVADTPPAPLSARRRGRSVAVHGRRGLALHLPDVVQTAGVSSPHAPSPDSDDGSYDAWYRCRIGNARHRATAERAIARLRLRPRFSVLLPVHDADPVSLRHAIASVRSQWYQHWELRIVDDASTQLPTLAVLADASRLDPRVRVQRLESSAGPAAATNRALSLAHGEFVALLDQDGSLEPDALFQVARLLNDQPDLDLIYTDGHTVDADGRFSHPALKPGFSPDLLLSMNYLCDLTVIRTELLARLGGLRTEFDGAQDFDLVLRAVEQTDRIGHVARPLYRSRVRAGWAPEPDAGSDAAEAGRRAVADALARRGRSATVETTDQPGRYRVRYRLAARPQISIVIPTRDRVDLLRLCVDSIRERSTYPRYELVIVDNASTDPETLDYLDSFPGRVLRYPYEFHYARMMNFAALAAVSDQLLFLNNDVQVVSDDWLESMLEHGQRPEVGGVGAYLSYPDGIAQHQGVYVGGGQRAGAINVVIQALPTPGHEPHLVQATAPSVRNLSAVTGACLLIRPSVFWEVGGFDERLHIAFNDVDLGLKLRHRGYEIVFTPYAQLVHDESSTRGSLHPMDNDRLFRARWRVTAKYADPYCNPNYDPARRLLLHR